MNPTFVIGDVHGYYEKLVVLLRDARLIDGDLHWCAADARLWFMGDYFDRGPDGIGVIDLIRRLQYEASAAGGAVGALIGNHEPLIVSAQRFGRRSTAWGGTFWDDWHRNGGQLRDLEQLTPERIAWIAALPAMARAGEALLMHADALFYRGYGRTIADVNAAFRELLVSDDAAAWDRLLDQFTERMVFADAAPGTPDLAAQFVARDMLRTYGGQQIIHGHTPIKKMTGQAVETIHAPLIYAGGVCINVDGGMGHGGAGFVYEVRVGTMNSA